MKLPFVTAFIMTLANPVFAAQVLTWNDCVKIAGENNAQIQAARAALRSLDFLEDGSKANFLPSITATAGYTHSEKESKAAGGNANTATATNFTGELFNAGLRADLNLFSGFSDLGKVWEAQANERAGEANLRTVKAQVSLDLKTAFEGLLYSKEAQKLTQQIIKRRQENLGLVELRFQGGRENKGSVMLSRAYLAQAKYDDLQARNAMRVTRSQLARALGYDDFAEFDIVGAIPITNPSTELPNFRAIAATTPEFAGAKAQAEAAEAKVVQARSTFMPTVGLTGSIANSDTAFFPDETKVTSLGVNISFPLFTGGKDYNTLRSSMESRSSASIGRANISRQLLARLEQSFASYLEAVAKFEVDSTFRDATTVRAEIARKKYNNGLQTFEDWDVIESDLINRQKTYLQSKRDRVIAEATWEQTQGKGVFQ